MSVSISVSLTDSFLPTFLLSTASSTKYLLSSPSSLSRLLASSPHLSISRLSAVCLPSPDTAAGMPGLLMGGSDSGIKKVALLGGRKAGWDLATARGWTRRDALEVELAETDETGRLEWEDTDAVIVGFSDAAAAPTSTTTADERPAKRARLAAPSSSSSSISATRLPNGLISTLPGTRDFAPSSLNAKDGLTWRHQVVSDMFRHSRTEGGAAGWDAEAPGSGTKSTVWRSRDVPLLPPGEQRAALFPSALPLPQLGEQEDENVHFLLATRPKRGKFKPEVALKLGVTNKRDWAKLTAGQKVFVPAPQAAAGVDSGATEGEEKDGKWVEGSMCMDPEIPGLGALFVFLKEGGALPPVKEVNEHLAQSRCSLRTVYWISSGVDWKTASRRIGGWIDEYEASEVPEQEGGSKAKVKHSVWSTEWRKSHSHNPLVFPLGAVLSARLSLLDSSIFRVPQFSNNALLSSSSSGGATTTEDVLSELRGGTADRSVEVMRMGWKEEFPPVAGSRTTLSQLLPSISPPSPEAADSPSLLPPPYNTPAWLSLLGALKPPHSTPAVLEQAQRTWDRYVLEAAEAREQVSKASVDRELSEVEKARGDDRVEVTALGTGSATPSKYRNVSATLLRFPIKQDGEDMASILLDAGEGTWGQMCRAWGEQQAKEMLRKELRIISLSHMHADHHSGLEDLLRARMECIQESDTPLPRLLVICPPGAATYIREKDALRSFAGKDYLGLVSGKAAVDFVWNWKAELDRQDEEDIFAVVLNEVKTSLGLVDIFTVPVKHRCRCWGIVISHSAGWKVVYSGDTMPCDALVQAGKGATLLIHEATIEDSMPELAEEKGHSTFGQAIDVATRMNAKKCLLTHFSARYPKLPPVWENVAEGTDSSTAASAEGPEVAIAFDLMSLKLSDFWKMAYFRKPFATLFSDGEDETDLAGSVGTPVEPTPAAPKATGISKKDRKKAKQAALESQAPS